MRVLVIGVRGAVGTAAAQVLRDQGHEVVGTGRQAPSGGVSLDLDAPDAPTRLSSLAADAEVVIDASGRESTRVLSAIGPTPLVDVSASAPHLERLRSGVSDGGAVVLGAGIAPGASTILVRALGVGAGDEVDVSVVLGGGETHGPAAVEWTARLAGADVYAAPEVHPVRNLRSRRRLDVPALGRRMHLRADFPDDLLEGRHSGAVVRTWLAMDTRTATAALALVGRLPGLAGALRFAPHIGSDGWAVTAIHHASGRRLGVTGRGQSVATGALAALAAEEVVGQGVRGAVTMADLVGIDRLDTVDGVDVVDRRLITGRRNG